MTNLHFRKVPLEISVRVRDIDILEVRDDATFLTLELEDISSQRRFLVQFENYLAYRKYLENHALQLVDQKMQWEDKQWFLYVSQSSDYIDWFNAQSYGISAKLQIQHYCLFSIDYVVEVLCIDPPKIIL